MLGRPFVCMPFIPNYPHSTSLITSDCSLISCAHIQSDGVYPGGKRRLQKGVERFSSKSFTKMVGMNPAPHVAHRCDIPVNLHKRVKTNQFTTETYRVMTTVSVRNLLPPEPSVSDPRSGMIDATDIIDVQVIRATPRYAPSLPLW